MAYYSVQREIGRNEAQFGRLDEARMGHQDLVQPPLEILAPEIQEALELGKARVEIVVLPDVALDQRGMIWHPLEDFSRRQAVAAEHRREVVVGHWRFPFAVWNPARYPNQIISENHGENANFLR